MIKRMTLLVRKSGLSKQDFKAYWREKHASIVLQMPCVAGYNQNPVLRENSKDFGRRPTFQLDGLVELWFKDEVAQSTAFSHPAAQLLPVDEPNFIRGITILSIHERRLIEGTAGTKTMFVLDIGDSTTERFRSDTLAGIEEGVRRLPAVTRLVLNRVTASTNRDGLWFESTPPDVIIELGTEAPAGIKTALASSAFAMLRERVRAVNGRLAVRAVEEVQVISMSPDPC